MLVSFSGLTAAERHWVGTASDSNWDNTNNWSTTAGGPGGASLPGAADDVYFNPQNSYNCWIGSAINVASINIRAGYTAVVSISANIEVAGTFKMESGVFIGSDNSITIKGDFLLSGGAFNSTSGTLDLSGNATFNSDFVANSGTVRFNLKNHSTIQGTGGTISFYNVIFNNTGGSWINTDLSSATPFVVNGNLEFAGTYRVWLRSGIIQVKKDILLQNTGNGGGGSTTIELTGNSNQTIYGNVLEGRSGLPSLKINKPSGTLFLIGTVTLGGDFRHLSGNVDPGTSQVSSVPEGDITFEGSFSFYNFAYKPVWNGNFSMSSSTNITILNDLVIGGQYNATFHTGTLTAKGNIYINNNGDNDWGSATFVLAGTGNQTIVANSPLNKGKLPGVTINKPSGILTLPGLLNVTGNWTHMQGQLDVSSNNSTVAFCGNNTITGTHTLNHVIFSGRYSSNYSYSLSSGTVLSLAGSLSLEGVGNLGINGGEIRIGGNLNVNNTALSGGGTTLLTFVGSGDQYITGNVSSKQSRLPSVKIEKPSGKLVFPSLMTVYGNWDYQSGLLDVTTNSSTVIFNGRQSFLGKYHELNNVTFLSETNEEVNFGTSQVGVNGHLKFEGTTGLNLYSGSSTASIFAKGDITVSNTSFDGSGTAIIEISGSGNQNFTGNAVAATGNLSSIVINKASGTLTLSNTISVRHNWKHVAGLVDPSNSTVVFANSANSKELSTAGMNFNNLVCYAGPVYLKTNISLMGNLSFSNGTLYSDGKNISLKGNWQSSSKDRFVESTGIVTLNGAGAQVISCSGGETFTNLSLSGSNYKTFADNVTVTNKLTFNGGIIQTGSNKLSISSGATVEKLAANSFVYGNLEKYIAAGTNITQTFEVGNLSEYTPAVLTFPTVSSPGTIIVSAIDGDHPQLSSSGLDISKSVNSYWALSNWGVSPLLYNLTLHFNSASADPGVDYTKLKTGLYAGATWTAKTVNSRSASMVQMNSLSTTGAYQIAEPLIAAVSITANLSGEICYGTDITFTATSENGGPAPTYQWKVDGNNVGTNSTTFSSNSLVSSNVVTCTLTSSYPLISGTVTSNTIAPTISSGKWLGTVSSDWNNANNWCGGIPSSNVDVVISSGTPYMPAIAANGQCRNLTIQAGATLTLNEAGISIAGNLVNDGVLNTGNNLVSFNGSGAQEIGGQSSNSFSKIAFEGGGTKLLTAAVNVSDLVTVKDATVLNSNGNLTLLATATSNANIGALQNGAAVQGDVNVQSFFTGGDLSYRGTRIVSSPINDAQSGANTTFKNLQQSIIITGPGGENNGFDKGGTVNPNGASLLRYDETVDQSKSQYKNVSHISETVEPGEGFYLFYRGSRSNYANKVNAPYANPESVTVTYKGAVNQGNITRNLTYNYYPNEPFNGFNLVGNPYPAIIDWEAVIRTNTSNEIRIIKPTGGCITYSGGFSLNAGDQNFRYIQPGQGFFVKATGPGASITFTESAKDFSTAPGRLLALQEGSSVKTGISSAKTAALPPVSAKVLRFNLQDAKNTEEALIVFSSGKSAQADLDDAVFFTGSTAAASTLSDDSVRLAINFMPDIAEVEKVRLHVDGGSGSVRLNFTDIASLSDNEIFLKDNFLNKIIDIKENRSYEFSIDRKNTKTFGASRFNLLFTPRSVLPGEVLKLQARKAYTAVVLDWELKHTGRAFKYVVERSSDKSEFEPAGEVKANAESLNYFFTDVEPLQGLNYYRIKQVNVDGKSYYSTVKEVNYTDAIPEIQAYPNPASEILNIKFVDRAKPVTVRVYNLFGSLVKEQSFQPDEQIQVDVKSLNPNVYVLQLNDTMSGKTVSKLKFVKD
ncbi:T9SS type A sorting domain-containing protein [Pedobacter sp. SYSU D00535]|uniref:T9SS type A sorting domain-containing protein n=1 Tax=Pedobacter sp. SYSU D00535 TaxID=2810308 RepID=UPI001A96882B|nr:T9SS type A sorting domain-containing protein [Pedobacter sp. SYSU D00535]